MRSSLAGLSILLWMLCIAAHAATASTDSCASQQLQTTRWVGDKANDSKCTDDNIQSAILATANNGSACPAKIFITQEHLYTAQHLTISNTGKNITFIGQDFGVRCGVTDIVVCFPNSCPPPQLVPLVTLSGTEGQSVFHIDGDNDITFRYLTITRASLSNFQTGGGIYFSGSGSLTLDTSVVSFNQAGAGGGIEFVGAPSATLRLDQNSVVIGNTATASDGGGIHLQGNARLIAVKPNTIVTFNHAPNGDGGGIALVGPARVDMGTDYAGGAVSTNDASNGGGFAALDNGSSRAVVRLFNSTSNLPTIIAGNRATHNGGGFYGQVNSRVCLMFPHVTDNAAQDGAAFYMDGSDGQNVGLYLNNFPDDDLNCGPESSGELLGSGGGCVNSQQECSIVTRNLAVYPDGSGSTGAIATLNFGRFAADLVKFERNHAEDLLRMNGASIRIDLSLITDNSLTGSLVNAPNGQGLDLLHSTIANNTIAGNYVFELIGSLAAKFSYDVIDQPGKTTVSGSIPSSQFVVATEISSLGNPVTNVQAEARFADPEHDDYSPRRCSPAVDVAPPDPAEISDYFGYNFDFDVTSMPNLFGPSDIGAFEYENNDDTIFCSPFGR